MTSGSPLGNLHVFNPIQDGPSKVAFTWDMAVAEFYGLG